MKKAPEIEKIDYEKLYWEVDSYNDRLLAEVKALKNLLLMEWGHDADE